MKIQKNNPHLTAKERTSVSFPTNWLKNHNRLKGEILDFGCGFGFDTDQLQKEGFDIVGYDNYYRPEYPTKRFDTIICNYVLNVLEQEEQAEVLMAVSELLKPDGVAYFAVRRDLKSEGFRMHLVHRQLTYQCVVVLPYKSVFSNENCEIYEYRHFNKTDYRKKYEIVRECPFCNLNSQLEVLSEIATAVAFFDGYPVSKGHTLIIPKRHVENYFDLTTHEQRALWLLVNRCKKLLTERFHPAGFNVGINVGEAAGQSIFHVHIHLIPRYNGDVENPKGGVRGVIPGKQKY
ncbi:MAG: bifunctional class I SAM-dependent methyltransferase/HIT family protein [Paludibacteraceae bacterium]|nr:bifunctional class I SAM-dependent methyltransferase/HIT family protein [Paludibacteraceae bacterium]